MSSDSKAVVLSFTEERAISSPVLAAIIDIELTEYMPDILTIRGRISSDIGVTPP